MKCFYEVLGVPMNVSAEVLKKTYRRLALEWHPDKNLHRLEEATETFRLIQQAYEILIDPQERAWYDRHREDILQGGFEDDYEDNCLNVYQYYNTSVYKGYSDDDKSFYTVYRTVFEKISAEDIPFVDDNDGFIGPSFGYSYSLYGDVVHAFYAYWQSYCTAKTYSWVEKHNLAEARRQGASRQVIRLMEKENKKLRDQHKKIRNEEVRQLVAFVRKRDKRVQAHKKVVEEQSVKKAKKVEEQRKRQLEERKKNLEDFQETEWTSMSQLEGHLHVIEAHLDDMFGAESNTENDDSDECAADISLEDVYCVACDKVFKSAKAMKNHKISRKHKENVIFVKQFMQESELELKPSQMDPSILDDCIDTEDTGNFCGVEKLEPVRSSRKKKKKKKIVNQDTVNDLDIEVSYLSNQIDDTKLYEANDIQRVHSPADLPVTTDGVLHADLPVNTEGVQNHIEPNAPLKRFKKGKGNKKKGKDCSNSSRDFKTSSNLVSTTCKKCGNDFDSRNKLFEHLKETDHSVNRFEKMSCKQ